MNKTITTEIPELIKRSEITTATKLTWNQEKFLIEHMEWFSKTENKIDYAMLNRTSTIETNVDMIHELHIWRNTQSHKHAGSKATMGRIIKAMEEQLEQEWKNVNATRLTRISNLRSAANFREYDEVKIEVKQSAHSDQITVQLNYIEDGYAWGIKSIDIAARLRLEDGQAHTVYANAHHWSNPIEYTEIGAAIEAAIEDLSAWHLERTEEALVNQKAAIEALAAAGIEL